MGIKHIIKLLKKHAKGCIMEYSMDRFRGMSIAIDASSIVYQTVIAMRSNGKDLTNKKGEITSHLKGILDKINNFLSYDITPIFVFDGIPPDFKKKTLEERSNRRKKATDAINKMDDIDITSDEYLRNFKMCFKPTEENYNELRIMLDLMGIPYVNAPGEADVVCAWLTTKYHPNGKRFAKLVCAEDSDMLAFGASYLAKDMSKYYKGGKTITIVSHAKILEILDMNREQFVNLCTLLGCDHTDNIPTCGPVKALSLATDHKSLEKIISMYKKKFPDLENEFDFDNMINVRDYFMNGVSKIDKSNFKVTDHNLFMREVQETEFIDFMCAKHNFYKNDIEFLVNKVIQHHDRMNIQKKNTGTYHKLIKFKFETLDSDTVSVSDSNIDSDADIETNSDSDFDTQHQHKPNNKKNNKIYIKTTKKSSRTETESDSHSSTSEEKSKEKKKKKISPGDYNIDHLVKKKDRYKEESSKLDKGKIFDDSSSSSTSSSSSSSSRTSVSLSVSLSSSTNFGSSMSKKSKKKR